MVVTEIFRRSRSRRTFRLGKDPSCLFTRDGVGGVAALLPSDWRREYSAAFPACPDHPPRDGQDHILTVTTCAQCGLKVVTPLPKTDYPDRGLFSCIFLIEMPFVSSRSVVYTAREQIKRPSHSVVLDCLRFAFRSNWSLRGGTLKRRDDDSLSILDATLRNARWGRHSVLSRLILEENSLP